MIGGIVIDGIFSVGRLNVFSVVLVGIVIGGNVIDGIFN